MPRLLIIVMLLLFVGFAGAANALVKFDFEQKYFTEFDTEVKDHSLIRADGVYHLFYLRGNPAKDIGHATSTDLIHWKMEDPVLPTTPGSFDHRAVWAPQVIKYNGYYIMYYTGVNVANAQQTGIAMSADLYNWYKIPWPVYHPDPAWALWNENAFSHGRDPFMLEDSGTYILVNTAKTLNGKGAVACATSADLFNWSDVGPLYVHDSWHVLESVQMRFKGGLYHMFFTEETVLGTSYMSSPQLASGWDIANRILIDFGAAPEVNEFDPGEFILSRHALHSPPAPNPIQYVIKFNTLLWSGENQTVPYVDNPWPLEDNWDNISGNAFLFAPTFLDNPQYRGETTETGYEGMSWLSSYERYQGPLAFGNPGLFQGDSPTGVMRSRTFTFTANSMTLLVGGGDRANECYVALVDANTQQILLKETGKDTDEMDLRTWDIRPFDGRSVYIEIVDNAAAGPFGHISCDEITESFVIVGDDDGGGGEPGDGRRRDDNPIDRSDRSGSAPSPAVLHQNSPNPFNPTTTISFYIPADGAVRIDIFDAHGRLVRRLADEHEAQGTHFYQWNGRNAHGQTLSSGVYFYRLSVDGNLIDTKKMILLK